MSESKPKTLRARIASAIKGETTPGVDPDVVRDLARLLEETGLSEIEVERGGVRVRVARNGGHGANAGGASTASSSASSQIEHAAPTGPAPALKPEDVPKPVPPPQKPGTLVSSPMVGTVYLAPQPGAPPFVRVGDPVTDGTILIIEAMKTMNPVAAPKAGRIVEIYVQDGQPVEFGQPLMLID
jgi:acetyl-CoA carboxylase biotin carboxyl carrier protein